jgi:hypothetical protein
MVRLGPKVEPCAEKMVMKALAQESSRQDLDEMLRILAVMQKRQCVIQAHGPDTTAHMEKPLATGRPDRPAGGLWIR